MTWNTQLNNVELSTMQMLQRSISNKEMCAVQNNFNTDLENVASSWFIQNSMKPNPDKYQAIVLGKTEDKLNFKLADGIDTKTTQKTCLLDVVLDNELKFDDHF